MSETIFILFVIIAAAWLFGRMGYSNAKLSSRDKETVQIFSDRLLGVLSKSLRQEVEITTTVSGRSVAIDILIGSGFDATRREIHIPYKHIQDMDYWSRAAQKIIGEYQPRISA